MKPEFITVFSLDNAGADLMRSFSTHVNGVVILFSNVIFSSGIITLIFKNSINSYFIKYNNKFYMSRKLIGLFVGRFLLYLN